MPYSTERDRTISPLEIEKSPWPLAPLNLSLRSGYSPGVFELTWDSPTTLAVNQDFQILGVNLYRSFDSEWGPFERITELPLGTTFWRDMTDNVLIPDENVSDRWSVFGAQGNNLEGDRYIFKTLRPIVKEGSQGVHANHPNDVRVYVDGVQARVKSVRGQSGEVELDVRYLPEVGTQSLTKPVVPTRDSVVLCAYRYTKSLVKTNLAQRVFYRVTTVGMPGSKDRFSVQPQDLIETPIESAIAVSSYETEKLDNIWQEAIRRNRWLLGHGGERVKVFLRKHAGIVCPCLPDDYHKQPLNDCTICYGTGFVGGYEGPFDIIVAPPDAEKRITQKERGQTVEESNEVWTSPSPILSQRDFIVKVNGERYSIGAVRFPSNRGMILQQHFNTGHIDESDIRYKVPVNGVRAVAYKFQPETPEYSVTTGITNNPEIPDEREIKGRTRVWENDNE